MARTENKVILQPHLHDTGTLVTGKTMFYAGLGVAIVGISLATLRVDPAMLIGGIIGVLGLLMVFKYPFFGFFKSDFKNFVGFFEVLCLTCFITLFKQVIYDFN